jgi:phytoene dehydrogenase-like protein
MERPAGMFCSQEEAAAWWSAGHAGYGRVSFDTSPTLLLALGIYRFAFDALGRGMDDWSELRCVEPAYRVFLSDNTPLAQTADMVVMREQLEALEPAASTASSFSTRATKALMRGRHG